MMTIASETNAAHHPPQPQSNLQQQRQHPPEVQPGNLQTLLSNFDVESHNHAATPQPGGAATVSSDVSTLHLDGASGGGQRDRSSTFGSVDFDLGFGFGTVSATHGQHGAGALGKLLSVHDGGGVAVNAHPTPPLHPLPSPPSSASTASTAAPLPPLPSAPQVPAAVPPTSSAAIAVTSPVLSSVGSSGSGGAAVQLQHHDHSPGGVSSLAGAPGKRSQPMAIGGGGGTIGPPSQPSSEGSTASGFLQGILSGNPDKGGGGGGGGGAAIQPLQKDQKQPQMVAHTPPSALGTSYEAKHFGKRMRSGSISGRLRSASDLEDRGVIDRDQKAIMKDLIISGDDDLQKALDRYEQGDASQLESMIRSGALHRHTSEDIDLLGDLDLDFLTVHDFGATDGTTGVAGGGAPAAVVAGPDGTAVGAPAHPGAPPPMPPHARSKSMPIPMRPPPGLPTQQQILQMTGGQSGGSGRSTPQAAPAHMGGPPSYDDGIGELDFNHGDFSGNNDDQSTHSQGQSRVGRVSPVDAQQRDRSNSLFDPSLPLPSRKSHAPPSPVTSVDQRWRSNSLAFGGLLNEPSPSSEAEQVAFSQWTTGTGDHAAVASGKMPQSSNILIGAGGAIPNPLLAQSQTNQTGGGIGAILGSHVGTNSPANAASSGTLTKKEGAAERRRIKQEQKEQRERDRLEKRERRERETREKKERDARERQHRKERKAAAGGGEKKSPKLDGAGRKTGTRQESDEEETERTETPSGLGIPRSMSDPNLHVSMDENGLLHVDRPEGWIGAYSPESRKIRIDRFLAKRNHRVWTKKVKYDVRKNFADSRLRVKGRFVKKEDELLMRDLMSLT